MPDKSILDGVPVTDKAFPLNKANFTQPALPKVSSCPRCGAPIYGKSSVDVSDLGKVPVVFTCECVGPPKSIEELTQTK